jgi:hypothetical protein
VSLTSDRVCLDYRNYEGNPVRLMFRRCTPLGDIAQLTARAKERQRRDLATAKAKAALEKPNGSMTASQPPSS